MIKLRNFLLSTAIAVVWIVFAPVIVKADVPVDAEHFPDENFREYISEKCDNDNSHRKHGYKYLGCLIHKIYLSK